MTDNGAGIAGSSLKVLMTADAVGGVWQYSTDLIAELTSRGTEVLLATMGPRPSSDQKSALANLPGVTLVESDFRLEWTSDPWPDVDAAGEWLLELDRRFGADIIHLNGYSHASLRWGKPVVCVAHSCVSSWWRAVHAVAAGADWNEYRRRVRAGLLAADAIVAPSHFMASALEADYSVAGEKITVITNFSRSPVSPACEKEPFILGAGRIWDAAKNLLLLDEVAVGLPWEVRLAGTIEHADDSRPAPRSAKLLGQLSHPELLSLMSRASIFGHPALYEPFGLSVLEAARAGCCLVLSENPTFRELWDEAALFVDPRDPQAWRREIRSLIDDGHKRDLLARTAKERAQVYKPETSVSKYLCLYDKLRARGGIREGCAA